MDFHTQQTVYQPVQTDNTLYQQMPTDNTTYQQIQPYNSIYQQAQSDNTNAQPNNNQQSQNLPPKCQSVPENQNTGWHIYQIVQRVPAAFNARLNYKQNHWISTSDLARRLAQVSQYTHQHQSIESQIQANNFILLDARGEREYRTSHIQGALHLPVQARICLWVRPGNKKVQQNFFHPLKRTPMYISKDNKVFRLLETAPRDIEIVVYCAVGFRSGWLCRAFTLQGFTNVSSVYGGVYKWANEGGEIFQFANDQNNPEYNGTKEKFASKLHSFRTPKKRGNKSTGEPDIDGCPPNQVDSQGNQLENPEIAAHSIMPHQFVATHMLAPHLKPHKA